MCCCLFGGETFLWLASFLCKQCLGHTLSVRLSNDYLPLGVGGVKMSKAAAYMAIFLALDDEEGKDYKSVLRMDKETLMDLLAS